MRYAATSFHGSALISFMSMAECLGVTALRCSGPRCFAWLRRYRREYTYLSRIEINTPTAAMQIAKSRIIAMAKIIMASSSFFLQALCDNCRRPSKKVYVVPFLFAYSLWQAMAAAVAVWSQGNQFRRPELARSVESMRIGSCRRWGEVGLAASRSRPSCPGERVEERATTPSW
jgi:hypothetical protein